MLNTNKQIEKKTNTLLQYHYLKKLELGVASGISIVADSDIGDVGIGSIFEVIFIDNSRDGITSHEVNLNNIERSGTSIISTILTESANINIIKVGTITFTTAGSSGIFTSENLGGITTLPVGAEVALGGTSFAGLGVVADDTLLVTTLVGTHRAHVGTTLVGADLALILTSSFVGADLALEVASPFVGADSAHGLTSSDGESTSSVGAHSALTVTTVFAELALSLTGGLVGFGGFEDGVVTSESHTFFGNFESTNDGVDDLLGGGGLDTEDLHVTVGTILGEGDEVRLGNGFSAHLGERGVTLVDGGLDNLSIEGGEESVGNVRFLGGLVGDESESEDSTAESSGEDGGSNEHLFGTVERSSESLDTKLKLSESRATSGFEFHF
jgi:hypothetical protein